MVQNGKKVLVVDDEPHLIRSLTFVLKKEGYDIDSAVDGEEALEKIRRLKPNLVFLDVMMPKKNGYEVCQEVKKDPGLSGVYVIMLTAKGQEADKAKAYESKADEFISKPFSPVGIVTRVKDLLK
ncbi:MAG: response regulator [Chloroflexi bacterium]|nr:response regulator [Chloroflexota bacterium]